MDFIEKILKSNAATIDQWVEAAGQMLPHIVMAVVVLMVSLVFGRLLRRFSKKPLAHMFKASESSQTLVTIVSQVIFAACLLIGVAIAAEILGLDKLIMSVLGSVGVLGLVAGYAFKDVAANFFAGAVITLRSPFGKGDYIEVADNIGYVESVDLLYTTIRTTDGQLVHIPNSVVYNDPVTNFSALGVRRVVLKTGVAYGDDLEKVRKLAEETVKKLPFVQTDPPISLFFTGIGGSSYDFDLRYWITFESNTQYRKALSEGIIEIKKAFAEADIDLPYPIRTLDFGVKGGVNLEDVPIKIAEIEGGKQ